MGNLVLEEFIRGVRSCNSRNDFNWHTKVNTSENILHGDLSGMTSAALCSEFN